MAAKRPIEDERNELVLKELEHIHGTIERLEASIATLASNLDAVRIAELSTIRANLSDTAARLTAQMATQDSEIKLLRYQMGRTSAVWSLISAGVASAIVTAVMALVMRH